MAEAGTNRNETQALIGARIGTLYGTVLVV
jgi:hypothetical protein